MKEKNLKTKRKKYVFIDTNIYLDYFRLPLDIIALQKLKELVEKEKIQLLLPRQVKDEYTRAKKKDISNELKNKVKVCRPVMGKDFEANLLIQNLPQAKEVLKNLSRLEGDFKNFLNTFEKDDNEIKRIDRLINDIFKIKPIQENDILLNRAFYRFLRGNPPFEGSKQEKYGDAIIWETLLDRFINCKDIINGELVIITDDLGWYEDKTKKRLNSFLIEEWKEKMRLKKLKLSSSPSLASFVNDFLGEVPIKKGEVDKEKIFKKYYDNIATFSLNTNLVSPLGGFVTQSRSLYCPFCRKDITIELENNFPELKSRTSSDYLTGTINLEHLTRIASHNLFAGAYAGSEDSNLSGVHKKEAECPYCKNKFDLNNII